MTFLDVDILFKSWKIFWTLKQFINKYAQGLVSQIVVTIGTLVSTVAKFGAEYP